MVIKIANQTYSDSFSQSEYISEKLNVDKPKVIKNGSLTGVDIDKYTPKKFSIKNINSRQNIKNFSKIKNFINPIEPKKGQIIFGFVGRIHKDKGIDLLIEAFQKHNKKFPYNKLLILGPIEIDKIYFYKQLKNNKNILHLNFTDKPHYYYPEIDILILPSLREGFGSVILEAAACKVPTISTKIPGPIDFIKHKENGYFIKKNSVNSILNSLNFFALNKNLISVMGHKAYNLVKKKYEMKSVTIKFFDEFSIH